MLVTGGSTHWALLHGIFKQKESLAVAILKAGM